MKKIKEKKRKLDIQPFAEKLSQKFIEPQQDNPYLYQFADVKLFAKIVGVHPQTIYYHIRKGHLKMPITIKQWVNRPQKSGPKYKYFAKTIDNDEI